MPNCNTCGYHANNFKDLAKHIIENRRKHPRKSVVWAEKFLTNAKWLNQKRDKPQGRTPLTEQEKKNKVDAHREVSGEEKRVITICPHCNSVSRQAIAVEYVESPTAWRNKGNNLMVNCFSCRK